MSRRELTAYYADGTARVVAAARDDFAGRRYLADTASRLIARGDVVRVHVSNPVIRTAQSGRRGYR